jgi:hypothetical protein
MGAFASVMSDPNHTLPAQILGRLQAHHYGALLRYIRQTIGQLSFTQIVISAGRGGDANATAAEGGMDAPPSEGQDKTDVMANIYCELVPIEWEELQRSESRGKELMLKPAGRVLMEESDRLGVDSGDGDMSDDDSAILEQLLNPSEGPSGIHEDNSLTHSSARSDHNLHEFSDDSWVHIDGDNEDSGYDENDGEETKSSTRSERGRRPDPPPICGSEVDSRIDYERSDSEGVDNKTAETVSVTPEVCVIDAEGDAVNDANTVANLPVEMTTMEAAEEMETTVEEVILEEVIVAYDVAWEILHSSPCNQEEILHILEEQMGAAECDDLSAEFVDEESHQQLAALLCPVRRWQYLSIFGISTPTLLALPADPAVLKKMWDILSKNVAVKNQLEECGVSGSDDLRYIEAATFKEISAKLQSIPLKKLQKLMAGM